MTRRRVGTEERLSVGPPAWFFLPFAVAPALHFVVRACTATDAYQRVVYWLGCLVMLLLAGFAVFSRVVVNGPKLSVPYNIFLRRSVRLDRLASAALERRTDRKGRYARGWWIILRDHDGRQVVFTLDRSQDADRDRLLKVIRRYADETSAEVTGPDEPLTG